MKDLKDYREREQTFFIIANALIFLLAHRLAPLDAKSLTGLADVLSKTFVTTVVSVIAFGFVWFVDCLFTSGAKDKLLYLFGLLAPPGRTVFSEIRRKDDDPRFSYRKLAEKYPDLYKNLPPEPSKESKRFGRDWRAARKARRHYENEQWYAIYDRRRDAQIVAGFQREALLCRDIYISALVLAAIYIVVAAVGTVGFNGRYFLFLCASAAVANLGANRKAKRFVYNVVAYDVNKGPKD